MSLRDFEIGRELGKGVFGNVCLVKRKQDRLIYAMKRVNISKLSHKEKENALNEIRILASLSNPNIIGYKEAFFDEESKTLNIVMEYADDGDLATKIKYNIKNRLAFREDVIWEYLIQILNGLRYLHENRIMHRDLKSANLFLMSSFQIKIGDLNVSKIAKLGMAYTQTGTPYYASPEIWKDKPYDYKSDVWSIGCVIYELCKLKPPFTGTSLKDLGNNIQKGVYSPISEMYSKSLSIVIAMMLVVNPVNRPSCDQLIKCDLIQRAIKENNIPDYFSGHKANLIKTIKMPKNFQEINRALPMKKYKNREEMLENDQYETMKQSLLHEERKRGKFNNYNKNKRNNSNNNESNEDILYNKNRKIDKNNKIKDIIYQNYNQKKDIIKNMQYNHHNNSNHYSHININHINKNRHFNDNKDKITQFHKKNKEAKYYYCNIPKDKKSPHRNNNNIKKIQIDNDIKVNNSNNNNNKQLIRLENKRPISSINSHPIKDFNLNTNNKYQIKRSHISNSKVIPDNKIYQSNNQHRNKYQINNICKPPNNRPYTVNPQNRKHNHRIIPSEIKIRNSPTDINHHCIPYNNHHSPLNVINGNARIRVNKHNYNNRGVIPTQKYTILHQKKKVIIEKMKYQKNAHNHQHQNKQNDNKGMNYNCRK